MSNYNNIIIILAAVYIAERFELHGNFFELQNPRFIIESGFKSRAGYNGARTVYLTEYQDKVICPKYYKISNEIHKYFKSKR